MIKTKEVKEKIGKRSKFVNTMRAYSLRKKVDRDVEARTHNIGLLSVAAHPYATTDLYDRVKENQKAPVTKQIKKEYAERELQFREEHPIRTAVREKLYSSISRAAGRADKNISEIYSKKMSASKLDKLTRPKFSKREHRLKYRPMAHNILDAHSY